MNLENTQVQMRKGILEFCILKVISKGEVYASDMLEELTSAKMMVVEGTLYPLLTRLRKAELVEYKWVESNSGPPRKYYTLTKKGKSFLEQLLLTWLELTSATDQILTRTQTAEKSDSETVKTTSTVKKAATKQRKSKVKKDNDG
ncbi:MAG: PadR family transcriptional regulator [Bacteroidota bacterium]